MTQELVPLTAPIAATPRKETEIRYNFAPDLTKVSLHQQYNIIKSTVGP